MSWIECINPFNNPVKHSFFRHIPGDKRFNHNDSAKICSICWYEAQKRNGTLPISNGNQTRTNSYINHLTVSKPGNDTL